MKRNEEHDYDDNNKVMGNMIPKSLSGKSTNLFY